MLTTASLVFDRRNSTFLPPINGIRQFVADTWRVAVARGLSEPPVGIDLGSQVLGPVFLVGEISEPVQSELVGSVLRGVVVVDESQVVLEDLEALLLLAERVVHLPVLHEPLLVHGHQLLLGAQRGGLVRVGVVVRDYRHV